MAIATREVGSKISRMAMGFSITLKKDVNTLEFGRMVLFKSELSDYIVGVAVRGSISYDESSGADPNVNQLPELGLIDPDRVLNPYL